MLRPIVRPLSPRDPHEEHRTASPLELFTDLCYVVAIAQAALSLHHEISEGHAGHGLVWFGVSFFAIFWAWLNFVWFNSAYDPDDTINRLLTLLQVFGSLVLAAGVPDVLQRGPDPRRRRLRHHAGRPGADVAARRGRPPGAADARRCATRTG